MYSIQKCIYIKNTFKYIGRKRSSQNPNQLAKKGRMQNSVSRHDGICHSLGLMATLDVPLDTRAVLVYNAYGALHSLRNACVHNTLKIPLILQPFNALKKSRSRRTAMTL